jgi:glycosyltransferase involved in cell wall biosynthesis
MKFSIIVPVYNKAAYVKVTIESVLAQTLSDFEVIVIDDGSSDGSGDIVAAISDPRVHLVRQANAGVSAARNRGIELAKAEWVVFLDADDWLHPHYLATQWATVTAHPQVDVVATQFRSSFGGQLWRPRAWALPDSAPQVEVIRDLAARWKNGGLLCASSVAVRTRVLRSLPTWFPVGESYGEDLDLWFRLNEYSDIALAHVQLVTYRKGLPGSLAGNQAANTSEQPFLLRMERRALDGSMPQRLRPSALRLVNELRIGLARRAIENNRRTQAIRLLWRARRSFNRHQWCLTAFMIVLAPAGLVRQWQRWRLRRRVS